MRKKSRTQAKKKKKKEKSEMNDGKSTGQTNASTFKIEPYDHRYTWDEADLKVKNVIYYSLGTKAARIFHQRNLHTMIDICSTNELVYELAISFSRPCNLIFDRFQLITVHQNTNKNMETFFRRLRELVSNCGWGSGRRPYKEFLHCQNEQ